MVGRRMIETGIAPGGVAHGVALLDPVAYRRRDRDLVNVLLSALAQLTRMGCDC
jgi:hypothetical protein